MFEKGIYLYIFYRFYYEMNISKDMFEEQVSEESDTDLNEEEDIIMDEIRNEHWRDVADESEDKKEIHTLRLEVYIKEKEDLINI